jgi:hypothetical protein
LDTGKTYMDSEGNECSIWQMVRREPEWAANRIQEGEKAIEQVKTEEKAKLILRDALSSEAWCSDFDCADCDGICDARKAINKADAISPPC